MFIKAIGVISLCFLVVCVVATWKAEQEKK